MKPKTGLFPGTVHNWRADKPLTPKVVWDACKFAAKQARHLPVPVWPSLIPESGYGVNARCPKSGYK